VLLNEHLVLCAWNVFFFYCALHIHSSLTDFYIHADMLATSLAVRQFLSNLQLPGQI